MRRKAEAVSFHGGRGVRKKDRDSKSFVSDKEARAEIQ